jgi:hypothetical protein
MTTPKTNKRRGAGFEIDLVDWLRERGFDAERLRLAGSKDEGDVVVRINSEAHVVIEAKAPGAGNAIDLAGWMKEAEVEVENYAKARGLDPNRVGYLLVIKARGKGIDQAYTVRRLGKYFQ